jgi:2-(3-amino-3-carboxypropyl)histidine synthase
MEEDRAATDIGVAVDAEMAAEEIITPAKQPKKRFIGRRAAAQRAENEKVGSSSIEDTGTVQGIHKHPEFV